MQTKARYTNDLIDRFCEAMASGLARRSEEPGVDVWPQPLFSPFEGNYFAHKEVISRLYNLFHLAEKRGMTLFEISQLFNYPSRAAHLMYLFLERPSDEKEVYIRREVAQKVLECIAILRTGDPFCNSRKNMVWDKEMVTEILRKSSVEDIRNLPNSNSVRTLVSKLIVMLSAYCEFIYFANLAFGREIHGAYEVNYGQLLVRDYFDLKPSFWGFSQKLPFSTARFFTIYPDIEVQFDFAGRLYTPQHLQQRLSHVYIEIEEKPLPIREEALYETLSLMEEVVSKAKSEIASLSRDQLMIKWVESYFWVLKPLGEQLNQDWHPQRKLYERIRTETPNTWVIEIMRHLKDKPATELASIIKKLFDPRNVSSLTMLPSSQT